MSVQDTLSLFGDEAVAVSDAAELLTVNGASLGDVLDLSDSVQIDGGSARLDSRDYTKDSLFDGDAAYPLDDAQHEAFLTQVAHGVKPMLAYLDCVSSRCSKKSASEQASRLIRRPLYRARLRVLIQERKAKQKEDEGEEGVTKDRVLLELQTIAFNRQASPGERRSALIDLAKMKGWMKGDGEEEKAGLPDPAALMDYLKRAEEQGVDPVAVAREALGEDDRAGDPPGSGVGDSEANSASESGVETQDVVVVQ